tara:strand:+ start:68 stop:277 length:210 start_codon:yes stop_codon:yes gene_type:complete
MPPKVEVILNGKNKRLESNKLSDLISISNLENKRFAIEINNEIVPKSQHDSFLITNQDKIEVVEAVGGG